MDDRPLQIAIVAGEPSGDRQGAALLDALREVAAPRQIEAWGIGGGLMRESEVALRHDSSSWGTIGIVEALAKVPPLFLALMEMKRALRRHPPDVLVLIDFGAFNVRLARWAKREKICPIFYFFPPGSWRRGAPGRKGKSSLAAVTDRIVTPFPWSAEFLRGTGGDAHFVGHPLLDLVQPTLSDEAFYERFGLDAKRPLIALMPGSRRQEIIHILPALIGAAGEIARRIPGVQFAVALAPCAPRALVEQIIRREQKAGGRGARLQFFMHQAGDKLAQIAHNTLTPPLPQLVTNEGWTVAPEDTLEPAPVRERAGPSPAPLVICEGLAWDVMARSDLVLTKSGTVTLEAMILQKPMIIVYRVSWLMNLEWQMRKRSLKITHMGLPNIIAGERVFAELQQEEATPEAIAELSVGILLQPERLLAVKARLAELVRDNLGQPGGVRRAAELLYETALAHEHYGQ